MPRPRDHLAAPPASPPDASAYPRGSPAGPLAVLGQRATSTPGIIASMATRAAARPPSSGARGAVYREDPSGRSDDGPLLPREEEQLMEGLLAGDDDAIAPSTRGSAGPCIRWAPALLGSREAAEELTQDVFLTAWRKAARFDPARGRLSTWLMTIAHNLAVDRLRRDRGGPTHPGARRRGARRARHEEGDAIEERDAASRALGRSPATSAAGDEGVLRRAHGAGDLGGGRGPARHREDPAAYRDDQGPPRERRQGAGAP